MFSGFFSSDNTKGNKLVNAASLFLVEIFARVKIADNPGKTGGKLFTREFCYGGNSTLPFQKVLIKNINIISKTRHDSKASNDYALSFGHHFPFLTWSISIFKSTILPSFHNSSKAYFSRTSGIIK